MEELFTAVVQHTDDKGRQISAEFALLPSRKEHQEYYAAFNNPVDLKQVAIKIQKGAYSDLEALVGDLLLMVDNALDFNKVASSLHKVSAIMIGGRILHLSYSIDYCHIFLWLLGCGVDEEVRFEQAQRVRVTRTASNDGTHRQVQSTLRQSPYLSNTTLIM